jgi:MYXO-CTERM domain-containing protein
MHFPKLALRGLLIAGLAALPALAQTPNDATRPGYNNPTEYHDAGSRGWWGLLGLLGLAGLLRRGHTHETYVDTRQPHSGRI